ncbi:MAG TPA: hypothetical protein VL098_12805 [Flavipsychrobacter sp.]|nr:hypothetical protein [Flavipsychrobacter sp.]
MEEKFERPMVEIYQDTIQNWRWQIKDAYNRETIGASIESYKNKLDCIKNLKKVGETIITSTIKEQVEFEFRQM